MAKKKGKKNKKMACASCHKPMRVIGQLIKMDERNENMYGCRNPRCVCFHEIQEEKEDELQEEESILQELPVLQKA